MQSNEINLAKNISHLLVNILQARRCFKRDSYDRTHFFWKTKILSLDMTLIVTSSEKFNSHIVQSVSENLLLTTKKIYSTNNFSSLKDSVAFLC